MNISKVNDVRIGMMTFDDQPRELFPLKRYDMGLDDDREAMRSEDYYVCQSYVRISAGVITNYEYKRGDTRQDLAFEMAHDRMLSAGNGNREDAPDVLVVITDGYVFL